MNIREKAPFDVYIGRTDYGKKHAGNSMGFGNPFVVGKHGPRGKCVEKFRKWFYGDSREAAACRERIKTWKDKRLGCFCDPEPCHGHVYAEFLDTMLPDSAMG